MNPKPNSKEAGEQRGERADPCGSDDGELFFSLLSSCRHQLLAFIVSLVPNRTDAEDVFQEASFVLWNKFQDYDRSRAFLPWACGVSFNVARNHLRSVGRDRLVFSDALLSTMAMERPALLEQDDAKMEALSGCLERLDRDDRALVEAFYTGQSSAKDIAKSMSRAVQTVYNRLTSIRRQLSTCIHSKMQAPAMEGDLA